MRRLAAFVSFVTLAVSTTTQAQDATAAREAFTEGTAAFSGEDYALALSKFQAALDAGMEGPAVHYNIAVSYYKLGDFDHAKAEFSLIAERYPAMRELAQYNLGLVARRQGEQEAAEAYFREALENNQDEKIRRLAAMQLHSRSAAGNGRWYGLINTRFGHDDNVRLVSNDVPVSSGVSAESRSTEFTALLSGPLSAIPGFRFDGSLYAIRYADASFYDQNFVRFGVVYQWRWGRWLAEGGPQLSFSTLDGDSYEQRTGAGLRFRRDISPELSFAARYIHDQVDSGAARFEFVEGSRNWYELRLDHNKARGRMTFTYSLESNNRGSTIASTRNRLALRYRYPFNAQWTADFEGSFRRSSYDDLATPRNENLTALSIDVTRHLTREWDITASMSLSSNDTVAPYSYDRKQFAFSFGKTFY